MRTIWSGQPLRTRYMTKDSSLASATHSGPVSSSIRLRQRAATFSAALSQADLALLSEVTNRSTCVRTSIV